jgi:AcrR family transcriptional regulator
MDVIFKIKINEKIFLKDPEESELGRKIVKNGLLLINKIGFENFTFKKLALSVKTTEATVYRYFENKHRLLIYLITWYWSYLEHKVVFNTNNISNPQTKIKKIIELLVNPTITSTNSEYVNEKDAYDLVMQEGSKAYLTNHINSDNKNQLFKPYKDLCSRFANIILEQNPKYKYPHSLATTIIEMSHSQKFFMKNLPSLTDFGKEKTEKKLIDFLEHMLFQTIK